ASRTYAGKSRGRARLKRSKSLLSKAGEPELRIRGLPSQHQPRDELADGRAVLEAVPRAAAHEPGVRRRGVAVDDEMVVRRVLVLADARLEQRRPLQFGETVRDVIAHRLHRLRARRTVAVRRIEDRPARVV